MLKKFSSFLMCVGRSLYSFAPEYVKVCRPSSSLSLVILISSFDFSYQESAYSPESTLS